MSTICWARSSRRRTRPTYGFAYDNMVRLIGNDAMNKTRIVLVVLLAAFVISVAWQVGSCVVANLELQDDMQDFASQLSSHIGLTNPLSEGDLSSLVVSRAQRYGIELEPKNIIVHRTGTGETSTVYIAADYTRSISLLGFPVSLRFTPSSKR